MWGFLILADFRSKLLCCGSLWSGQGFLFKSSLGHCGTFNSNPFWHSCELIQAIKKEYNRHNLESKYMYIVLVHQNNICFSHFVLTKFILCPFLLPDHKSVPPNKYQSNLWRGMTWIYTSRQNLQIAFSILKMGPNLKSTRNFLVKVYARNIEKCQRSLL